MTDILLVPSLGPLDRGPLGTCPVVHMVNPALAFSTSWKLNQHQRSDNSSKL